jgi:hypothetical protein
MRRHLQLVAALEEEAEVLVVLGVLVDLALAEIQVLKLELRVVMLVVMVVMLVV